MGFAAEADDPAVVDDAVDDGRAMSPSPNTSPRRLNSKSLVKMMLLLSYESAMIRNKGARPVDVDGQVAQLVDDQESAPADSVEFAIESVVLFGLAQLHDQRGGGEEHRGDAVPAGLPAQRDGQVGLAAANVTVEHEVLGAFDEVEREQVGSTPVIGETGCAPVVSIEFLGQGDVLWAPGSWRSCVRLLHEPVVAARIGTVGSAVPLTDTPGGLVDAGERKLAPGLENHTTGLNGGGEPVGLA